MIKKATYIFLLFASLIICKAPILNAQSGVNDFLLSAYDDNNLNQFDSQIKYINQGDYGVPLIKKMELRYDNDKMIKEDQEYALRLKAVNPLKLKYNNAVFNASKKQLETERQISINLNLYNRYELAMGYMIEDEASKISEKQLKLTNQIVDILTENQQSALFDPQDYVDLKLKQIEAIKKTTDTKQRNLLYTQNIASMLSTTSFDWSNFELISVQTLEKNVHLIANRQNNSLNSALLANKIDVTKKELKLDNYDLDLGFFQTKYIPYTTNKSKFGITFGVNIPLFKPKKNKVAESKLKELSLYDELDYTEKIDSINRSISTQFLLKLIDEYYELEQQVEELDIDSISKNMGKIQSNNPLTHLEMKLGVLKLEELLLKSKKAILEQYLEFLMAFDALVTPPLINHISENLEPLH